MAVIRMVPKGHPLTKKKPPRAIYFRWLLVSIVINVLLLGSNVYLMLRK